MSSFNPVKITDTTLRDAHQSLLATRLKTEDMIPLAQTIDDIGFFSVEAWGGATFDSCIRYLNDDPWQRLRDLNEVLVKTPIQMLLRGQNLVGYRHYPDDVVEKFVTAAGRNGVDIFRVFDALNDIRNMDKSMEVVKDIGAHLQGTICYTTSPVHSTERFIELAQELYAKGCDSICIKDMAGLIMPEDARALITGIKETIDIPIDLHCHSTSGISPMSYQAAIEAGVDILDTAMSPFALGTSQPPTESIVASLQGTARDTGIDLFALREVKNAAQTIRNKYAGLIDPISERVDSDVLLYQLPGGMISNLVSQLKEQNALDKLEEVHREIPHVREDLGYPPLVTPTSQIVGTQAVFNVLMGGRYNTVTQEVKDYVKGLYGHPPGPISSHIRTTIIDGEEPFTGRPADLLEPIYEIMAAEAREQGLVTKDEDILTYIIYPAIAPSFLKGERTPEPIPQKQVAGSANATTSGVPSQMEVEVDGEVFEVRILSVEGSEVAQAEASTRKRHRGDVPGGALSTMQGMVLKIEVEVGTEVNRGDVLVVLEAMKMENPIYAQKKGVVKEICVGVGDTVTSGEVLLVIE
jgi:pyruvate carboxylase subunit B